MSASRWLAYAGGAGVLSYGAYFAVQQKEVLKFEKEADDLSSLVKKEKAKIATNQSLITEQEQRIQELGKKEEVLQVQLSKAQERLKAAQKEVSKLEADTQAASASRSSLVSKLAALRSDSERIKEALTLGEKSLVIAKQKAQDAKGLINPLNHPLIAGKLGTKK